MDIDQHNHQPVGKLMTRVPTYRCSSTWRAFSDFSLKFTNLQKNAFRGLELSAPAAFTLLIQLCLKGPAATAATTATAAAAFDALGRKKQ